MLLTTCGACQSSKPVFQLLRSRHRPSPLPCSASSLWLVSNLLSNCPCFRFSCAMVAVQHQCNTIGLDKSAPLFVTTEVPFSSWFPCVLLFFSCSTRAHHQVEERWSDAHTRQTYFIRLTFSISSRRRVESDFDGMQMLHGDSVCHWELHT